jgi:predicted Zn-dependent protease
MQPGMIRRPAFLVALASTSACAAPTPMPMRELPPGRPTQPLAFVKLEPLAAPATKSPVLVALEAELARARTALHEQPSPPYFLAYTVRDVVSTEMQAKDGALVADESSHRRQLGIVLRVGDRRLDSSHWTSEERYRNATALPLTDDGMALRTAVWQETQRVYRQALERFQKLTAKPPSGVGVRPELTEEPGVQSLAPLVTLTVDAPAWEERLRALSARLKDAGLDGSVTLTAEVETGWYVNSEGSTVQRARPIVRLTFAGGGGAEDFEAPSFAGLPGDAEIARVMRRLAALAKGFAKAPRALRWVGPVLFEPGPAGVLLHEVLGHRLEGIRQFDESESQLLARKLGQAIMPDWISVFDDPLLARFGQKTLGGAYLIDDEGVPARRVSLVESGVLRGLLVGRTPVADFSQSDGHSRWSFYKEPAGRQSNLVLVASVGASADELRARLRAEARLQGLPYGLIVRDADGIFESPMNRQPVQFGVRLPRMVRVYVDDKPDLPLTGATLASPSVKAFEKVIAAGDDYVATNFGCFGDSGFVDVSATSPSLLFSELAIEPSHHYRDR